MCHAIHLVLYASLQPAAVTNRENFPPCAPRIKSLSRHTMKPNDTACTDLYRAFTRCLSHQTASSSPQALAKQRAISTNTGALKRHSLYRSHTHRCFTRCLYIALNDFKSHSTASPRPRQTIAFKHTPALHHDRTKQKHKPALHHDRIKRLLKDLSVLHHDPTARDRIASDHTNDWPTTRSEHRRRAVITTSSIGKTRPHCKRLAVITPSTIGQPKPGCRRHVAITPCGLKCPTWSTFQSRRPTRSRTPLLPSRESVGGEVESQK